MLFSKPNRWQSSRKARAAKRALDIAVAGSALAILSPGLAALAGLSRVVHGKPVLFAQKRPGLGGEIFTLRKFRTMTDRRDASGELLPDRERLTKLGRFMRATSLDELPELWNVLRGEMSLVGPRPLLVEYLELYTPEQARRHSMPPGLTGWCQVNGRNALSWDEKFELDLWYIDHWSVWLDLKILVRTLAQVVAREGVSHGGHETMPVFTGNETRAAA